jgi:hypothetical protein
VGKIPAAICPTPACKSPPRRGARRAGWVKSPLQSVQLPHVNPLQGGVPVGRGGLNPRCHLSNSEYSDIPSKIELERWLRDGGWMAEIYPPRPLGTPVLKRCSTWGNPKTALFAPRRGFFLGLSRITAPSKAYLKNSLNRVIGYPKEVGKLRTRSKQTTPNPDRKYLK